MKKKVLSEKSEWYKFKIKVGDPSEDGHGISRSVTVKTSHSVSDIYKAYHKSCEKTGLVFQENQPIPNIDWKHSEYSKRRVCVDYQDSSPSELAWDIFKKWGIEETEVYEEEGLTSLFLNFCKISLPDLVWKIVPDDTEEFSISIGYGLFD